MDVREKAQSKKRLIDANELKKKICFKCNDEYSDEPCDPGDCVFCNAINDAQTIDAVSVVRCRDCKHWLKDVPGCTDFVGRCELANYMVGATGYCVYGGGADNG